MEVAIEQYLKSLNFKSLKEKIKGRKIYIWGAFVNGRYIREKLEEQSFIISGYIDGHKHTKVYDGLPIISPKDEIKKEKVFIIVAVIGVRNEIMDYLGDFSMKEDEDYVYISNSIPRIVLSFCVDRYEDVNRNIIEFCDNSLKCNIEFVGCDNRVIIGKNFRCTPDAYIQVENGSSITIGSNVIIEDMVRLEAKERSRMEISNGCRIGKDSRLCSKGASIFLGNYVTMGQRFLCLNGKTSSIEIGEDCMFANDVSIISSSGHSIINLESKENTSIKSEQFVKIENHVWLGKNVTVLHNSLIGNGSIVGANSLVKCQVASNCILAGNPAKVIKTNHTWDRRLGVEFEEI